MWVNIQYKKHSLALGVMYRPPSSNNDYFDNSFDQIDNVISHNDNIFLMGDLNEDYKFDKMHNSRLHQMEVLYGMKQLIKSHTRVTLTTSTLIGAMLTNNYESHILSHVHDTALSEHYMIYTVYSEMCKHKANNVHNEINFRNYKKFDIYD